MEPFLLLTVDSGTTQESRGIVLSALGASSDAVVEPAIVCTRLRVDGRRPEDDLDLGTSCG